MDYWQIALEGADVIINLTGKSVNCRYTPKNKAEIYNSRIESTYILGKAIENCIHPPKVWINSSSATIYRDSYDKEMDEINGEIGEDFSMDVCKKWEAVFNEFQLPQTRKIITRTGIVIGSHPESALAILKRLVKLGLGGKMGSGEQYMSVISEKNYIKAILLLIQNEKAEGVYNLVDPKPIKNKDFMKKLRIENNYFFGLNHPKWLLELGSKILGTETELILKSRRVVPKRLIKEGFQFRY